jgi:anti-sigma regulatory factor (Ser/Thr protein kinase)
VDTFVVEGHSALFYRDPAEYVAEVVPFLLEGLAEGASVGAAVPGPNLDLVRGGLGGRADQVRLFDMTDVGRNPGRILAEVMHEVVAARPGAPARIVDEPVWPGRTELEYPACVLHEALVNRAFRGRPVAVLCPYDLRLPSAVLADAELTHPCVVQDGVALPSTAYAPDAAVSRTAEPLPEPSVAAVFAFDGPRLAAARRFVRGEAVAAGIGGDRLFDLVLAVGELAANSIRHGGGEGTVRVWDETADDGSDLLVAEVADAGTLLDPLAGRRPASTSQLGGRGLLMVHHLADLVRTSTGPDGTATRTYWRCRPSGAGPAIRNPAPTGARTAGTASPCRGTS